MAVSLSPIFNGQQFSDNNGGLLNGGKIATYIAGSFTTQQITYSDSEGTVPNANPITLNSSGRIPVEIWLINGASYNLVLYAADGTTVLQSVDNVSGIGTESIPFANNLSGGAAGSLPYQSAIATTAMLGIGSTGQGLVVSGGLPAWGTPASASNLAGGAAGSLPYQTGSGTTSMLATASGVLVGGTIPTWSTAPALTGTNFSGVPYSALTGSVPTWNQSTSGNAATATIATTANNLSGGANGSMPYQTAIGTTAMLAGGTGGQVLTMAGGDPSWASLPSGTNTTFLKSAVPVGIPPSGTIATNGTTTFSVALPSSFTGPGGIWLYLPAGAVSGGSAGFYWFTSISGSTTNFQCTTAYLASIGVPGIPTGFSNAVGSNSAYVTPLTSVTLCALPIPANKISATGLITLNFSACHDNSFTDVLQCSIGSTSIVSAGLTGVNVKTSVSVYNQGVTNAQYSMGNMCVYNVAPYVQQAFSSIDTTMAWNLNINATLNGHGSFLVVLGLDTSITN